jgi:quercetin dioxygenase-like cupin family protein
MLPGFYLYNPSSASFLGDLCDTFASFAVKIFKRKERKERRAKDAKIRAYVMIKSKRKFSKKKKPSTRRAKMPAIKTEVKHAAWHTLEMEEVNPLFHRHFLSGENTMLARLMLKKGCLVPLHHHHNEQISYVVDGALKFTFPDEEIVVSSGEVVAIPPNVPHKAEALVDTLDFDIFSPPRADWISKSDQYLREGKETKSPRKVG